MKSEWINLTIFCTISAAVQANKVRTGSFSKSPFGSDHFGFFPELRFRCEATASRVPFASHPEYYIRHSFEPLRPAEYKHNNRASAKRFDRQSEVQDHHIQKGNEHDISAIYVRECNG